MFRAWGTEVVTRVFVSSGVSAKVYGLQIDSTTEI